MADELNNHFTSIFTKENIERLPEFYNLPKTKSIKHPFQF